MSSTQSPPVEGSPKPLLRNGRLERLNQRSQQMKLFRLALFLFLLTILYVPIARFYRSATKNDDPMEQQSAILADAPPSLQRHLLEHRNTTFSKSSFLSSGSNTTEKSAASQSHIIEQVKSISLSTGTEYLNTPSSLNTSNVSMKTKAAYTSKSTKIPQWMKNYFDWHRQQRILMNQASEMEDKVVAGVNYLIVECRAGARPCGGTADRLKPIPYYLLYANKTNRVLLIHWEKPCKLENFLVPGEMGIDWRTPDWLAKRLPKYTKILRSINTAEQNMNNKRRLLTAKIQTWDAGSLYYNEHGESDFNTVFSETFRTLFVPAPKLAHLINQTMLELGLVPGQYVSAHVRSKMPPKFFRSKKLQKQSQIVDKLGGFQFTGNTRQKIITIAFNAINCAYALMPGSPIYFASDSHDAVNYIKLESPFVKSTLVNISSLNHVSEPLHLDTPAWKNYTPADFYPAFLDLWIMGMSRCTSFGVGGFGRFGNLLSYNSTCFFNHRDWKHNMKRCPSIL